MVADDALRDAEKVITVSCRVPFRQDEMVLGRRARDGFTWLSGQCLVGLDQMAGTGDEYWLSRRR